MGYIKRFEKPELKYDIIEKYINGLFLKANTCTEDCVVIFKDSRGFVDKCLFTEDGDCFGSGWLTCSDDYIEGQKYIDLIGIIPISKIYCEGNFIGDDDETKVLDYQSLATAINKCNEALKNKPEYDFSGIELIK